LAKQSSRFVCQSCGTAFAKWSGRCEGCGEWNSIVEETPRAAAPGGLGPVGLGKGGGRGRPQPLAVVSLSGAAEPPPRLVSGIGEFDRVAGGGLVPGSAVLVGGDPGVGKSTLLLQVAAQLARQGLATLYVTGEEAVEQIRLRAGRMRLADAPVALAAATAVRDIAAALDGPAQPAVVIIDSVQTLWLDTLESAPGTVSQVRGAAQELIRLAKARGFVLLLVGHVTKEGVIAGPKVLEHMVDTVIAFEGERAHPFRILRATKNRFGATDEIGVFEMGELGLAEVANPSALFLAERQGEVAGSAVFAGMEGTRPILVEIQALVAGQPPGTPRRAVVGWDSGRLAMVLAVLETRCGLSLAGRDVYLNVAGGLRIAEPAADLAVAAALVSAASGRPVPAGTVVFGEIGLSGEVRAVSRPELRLKEAQKLGFASALVPPARKGGRSEAQKSAGPRLIEIASVGDLVSHLATAGVRAGGPRPLAVERS
jgi:DNA repair protein RadA/Sms